MMVRSSASLSKASGLVVEKVRPPPPYLCSHQNTAAVGLSAGGFSNYFARPAYQVAAVEKYFAVAQGLPDKSLYNATGAGPLQPVAALTL